MGLATGADSRVDRRVAVSHPHPYPIPHPHPHPNPNPNPNPSQADYRTAAQFDLDKGVGADGKPDELTGLSPREQTEARLLLGRTYRQQLVTANAPTGGHGGEHASLARRNLEAFDSSPDAQSAASQLRQAGFHTGTLSLTYPWPQPQP